MGKPLPTSSSQKAGPVLESHHSCPLSSISCGFSKPDLPRFNRQCMTSDPAFYRA